MSDTNELESKPRKKLITRRRALTLGALAALGGGGGWALAKRYGGHELPPSMGGVSPLDAPGFRPDQAKLDAIKDLQVRSFADMDKLPWFTRSAEGELLLRKDIGLPDAVDIHTHFGWRHGIGATIDMDRRCPVQYFYDFDRDQDVLFEHDHPGGTEGRDITIEAAGILVHTPSRNQTHTAANLIAELNAMHLSQACLLPIEIPTGSHHAADTLAAIQRDSRFVPFGGVNPRGWSAKHEDVLSEQIKAYGIRGIKYHPVFQFVPPDHDDAMAMFEFCAAHNLLVFSHIGYTGSELSFMRANSEPHRLHRPLEAFPNLKLVCLHTGVRMIDETLEVARKHPEQVWLGLSGQPVPNITYILERYDTSRILFGSDWPFYPIAVMLARVLAATEGNDAVRQGVLKDNAARLLDTGGAVA
ncbi:MAG: amidohydrolase family protein [Candidatus Hydrogenedens sp.]|nr:amidohydrolase family protein [Candidatus Hydrogenedens sp.]